MFRGAWARRKKKKKNLGNALASNDDHDEGAWPRVKREVSANVTKKKRKIKKRRAESRTTRTGLLTKKGRGIKMASRRLGERRKLRSLGKQLGRWNQNLQQATCLGLREEAVSDGGRGPGRGKRKTEGLARHE